MFSYTDENTEENTFIIDKSLAHCTATGGPKQKSSWFTARPMVDLRKKSLVQCTAICGHKQKSPWFTARPLVDLRRKVLGSLHGHW